MASTVAYRGCNGSGRAADKPSTSIFCVNDFESTSVVLNRSSRKLEPNDYVEGVVNIITCNPIQHYGKCGIISSVKIVRNIYILIIRL